MLSFRSAVAATIGRGVLSSDVAIVKLSSPAKSAATGSAKMLLGVPTVIVDFSVLVRGYGGAGVVVSLLTTAQYKFKDRLLQELSKRGVRVRTGLRREVFMSSPSVSSAPELQIHTQTQVQVMDDVHTLTSYRRYVAGNTFTPFAAQKHRQQPHCFSLIETAAIT